MWIRVGVSHCFCLWDVGGIELVPIKISILQSDLSLRGLTLPLWMKTGGKSEIFTPCSWTEVGFEQRLAPGWALALPVASPSRVLTGFQWERQLCLLDDEDTDSTLSQPSDTWKYPSRGPALRQPSLPAAWAWSGPATFLFIPTASLISSFSLHLQYRFRGRCFSFGDSREGSITFTYDISPRYLRVF